MALPPTEAGMVKRPRMGPLPALELVEVELTLKRSELGVCVNQRCQKEENTEKNERENITEQGKKGPYGSIARGTTTYFTTDIDHRDYFSTAKIS